MKPQYTRIRALLFALSVLLLASCASQPPAPEGPAAPELRQQAAEAEDAGRLVDAAELLLQAAQRAEGADAQRLRLRAARLFLDAERPERGRMLLENLPAAELAAELRPYRQLLVARYQYSRGQTEQAWLTLKDMPAPAAELRPYWLALKAAVWEAVGQPLEAARLRVELAELLEQPRDRANNQDALWQALNQVPLEALRQRMPPPPDTFGAWLELAYLTRSYRLDGAKLVEALDQWVDRYPDHPAAAERVPELIALYREQLRAPEHMALMLPLSGPLAAAGQAVRDGFMAAYYAGEQPRPTLRVYDIGQGANNVLAAYAQAVEDGAQFVVGPLTKEAQAVLATRAELPAPVLALNTLSRDAAVPERFYQFGLTPEDDARAAADFALTQGWQRTVAVVPESQWGQRVAEAYTERFEAGGGMVLETGYYAAEGSDYTDTIEPLFNLDASTRRYRQLRSALRRDIEFEPRRRQDMDAIFMAAFPRQARLLRPQLRFFRALDVPVVGTSHAYSGSPSPQDDQDLEGLIVVDIPWLLQPPAGDDALALERLAQLWPQGVHQLPRLYALGIDAYRIVPYLGLMRQEDTIEGKSGLLTLDADDQVHRQLLPARFKDGQLEPLPQQNRFYGGEWHAEAPQG